MARRCAPSPSFRPRSTAEPPGGRPPGAPLDTLRQRSMRPLHPRGHARGIPRQSSPHSRLRFHLPQFLKENQWQTKTLTPEEFVRRARVLDRPDVVNAVKLMGGQARHQSCRARRRGRRRPRRRPMPRRGADRVLGHPHPPGDAKITSSRRSVKITGLGLKEAKTLSTPPRRQFVRRCRGRSRQRQGKARGGRSPPSRSSSSVRAAPSEAIPALPSRTLQSGASG